MSRSTRTFAGIAVSASAIAFVSPAAAQMSDTDVSQLPSDMRTAPIQQEYTETATGPGGVETVIRTRRIESTAPAQTYYDQEPQYAHSAPAPAHTGVHTAAPAPHGHHYAPAPTAAVLERDAWIAECERRTAGRSNREKGNIIGGLLGAVAGGVIGNTIAGAGDRLAGTLIGAGTGGLGGALLGGLFGGGKDKNRYDCAAALDSYISQYGHGGPRYASRTIAAPAVHHAPAYSYPAYAAPVQYSHAPAYSYTYAPPQQIVYVPVHYEQQQRVIVRETVREETYEVPAATRQIETPVRVPQPVRMIKDEPVRVIPAPAPRPIKMIKQ